MKRPDGSRRIATSTAGSTRLVPLHEGPPEHVPINHRVRTVGTTMPIDWNDPTARFALIERVGPRRYKELHIEHLRRIVVATVGGHAIRPNSSRFGRLFVVGDTGRAFRRQQAAEAYARKNSR
jgi:hypothetical protein